VRRLLERCLEKDPKLRLHDIGDVPLALEQTNSSNQAARQTGRRRGLVATAVVVMIAAAAAAIWYGRVTAPARSPGQVFRFSINPPPGAQFFRAPNRGGIAISQDGSAFVFTAVREGQMRLWLQRFNASVARELPGTEGAHLPFWSLDGRTVGFFAGGFLNRIDVDDGGVQIVADAVGAQGGTWNRDGVVLFASGSGGLFRVPGNGGPPVRVTAVDANRGEVAHVGPQFLSDGQHFVYMITSTHPDVDGAYVGSLADPMLKRHITNTDSWAAPAEDGRRDYLLWVRSGTVVAQRWDPGSLQLSGEPVPLGGPVGTMGATPQLAISHSGMLISGPPVLLQLHWVDRSGAPLQEIGESARLLSGPLLSPDLKKVAVVRNTAGGAGGEGGELMVVDLLRAVSSRLGTQVANDGLAWSPDSNVIAYGLRSPGSRSIALRRIDGIGPQTTPAPGDGQQRPIGWSGGSLVYYQMNTSNGRTGTWLSVARNGQAHRVATITSRNSFAQLSEDRRWLAYSSDDSGRMEVYVQRFEPAAFDQRRWQVSSTGGNFPRWRRDGKELFYQALDGQLMSVAVNLDSDTPDLSEPRVLFPLPTIYNAAYSYDAAPDGQRFLVVAPSSAQEQSSLSVVMNWRAAIAGAR
jgi:eukaryotic-like serine/threonine-protein kinase